MIGGSNSVRERDLSLLEQSGSVLGPTDPLNLMVNGYLGLFFWGGEGFKAAGA